jgi:hypothetical protein
MLALLLSVGLTVVCASSSVLYSFPHLWWVLLNAVLLQKIKLHTCINFLDTTILRLLLSHCFRLSS